MVCVETGDPCGSVEVPSRKVVSAQHSPSILSRIVSATVGAFARATHAVAGVSWLIEEANLAVEGGMARSFLDLTAPGAYLRTSPKSIWEEQASNDGREPLIGVGLW